MVAFAGANLEFNSKEEKKKRIIDKNRIGGCESDQWALSYYPIAFRRICTCIRISCTVEFSEMVDAKMTTDAD